jgi:hypothetical protein
VFVRLTPPCHVTRQLWSPSSTSSSCLADLLSEMAQTDILGLSVYTYIDKLAAVGVPPILLC